MVTFSEEKKILAYDLWYNSKLRDTYKKIGRFGFSMAFTGFSFGIILGVSLHKVNRYIVNPDIECAEVKQLGQDQILEVKTGFPEIRDRYLIWDSSKNHYVAIETYLQRHYEDEYERNLREAELELLIHREEAAILHTP
jgi:hypothetical protein